MMMRTIGLYLAGLLIAGGALAQPFQEGVHYQRIEPAQPTNDASRVEVVEVFSYACPACASFEPHIEAWLENKPEHVEFRRVPVVFRATWEPFARAYYTAEALGALDTLHGGLFDALHKQQRALRSNHDIAEWAAETGEVSMDDWVKASGSFTVDTRLRRGNAQAQRYGVDATPMMIVNGKYRVSGPMAGSLQKAIEVVNYLVEQEAGQLAVGESADAEASE